MSDGELLPVHTDAVGIDRPLLAGPRFRMLAIAELLRVQADVRQEPPTAIDLDVLSRFTVGWSAFVAMAAFAVLALFPGAPVIVRAIGAIGFWTGPIAVAAVVAARRRRTLPSDLRPYASAAIRRSVTGIRPIRWSWIGRRLLWVTVSVSIVLVLVALLRQLAGGLG
jgi:hypothetical protein